MSDQIVDRSARRPPDEFYPVAANAVSIEQCIERVFRCEPVRAD